jgi:predicted nucleotide-binding protein (sugar kinase/HSP70/actin superfamily)
MQGALANLGYRSQILPAATREDLLTGREVADIGQCCPTSFTTGNLVNYLRGEAKRIGAEEVSKNYIWLTAGSCGACRFGQYHQSYELALRNSGLSAFRMFLLGQEGLDQGAAPGGGLDLNLPFTLGAAWSVVLADVVQNTRSAPMRPSRARPRARRRTPSKSCIRRCSSVQGAAENGALSLGTSPHRTSSMR